MKIECVDVFEVSNDKGTIQFRKNDIVEIIYEIFEINEENEMNRINGISRISKKCLGRIIFIDTNDIEIDASKEYKSDIKTIQYHEIESIKLLKRENN